MRDNPVTDEDKKKFIAYYAANIEELAAADESVREAYRSAVEEGLSADEKWREALEAAAYGHYGGNCVYECSWELARDYLLELAARFGEEECLYYNSLGYIYYYGRCNGGKPEYDKALQYFTIAAVGGVFEARYKLADMMLYGKGLPVNKSGAARLILEMYDENYDIFCAGEYRGSFADISVRMGYIYENGFGVEQDINTAYYHYLQAEYAIKKRKAVRKEFGDDAVQSRIEEGLMRVRAQIPEEEFLGSVDFATPAILGLMLKSCSGLDITLDYRNGRYYIKGRTLAGTDELSENLITIVEMDFCELANEAELEIVGIRDVSTEDYPAKAFVTHIERNEDTGIWEFYHGDYLLLSFGCEKFVFDGTYGSEVQA